MISPVTTGRENILAFPLGPQGFLENFKPAAGEIIWNLPNGLQAYYLIQVKGSGEIKLGNDWIPHCRRW